MNLAGNTAAGNTAAGNTAGGDELDLTGRQVLVAGAGITGRSVVKALATVDANIIVTANDPQSLAELADLNVSLVPDLTDPPEGTVLVVTAPGFRPDTPLLRNAEALGIDVIGDVELAWRLGLQRDKPPVWLAITGTNGKTTTVTMLESILRSAGINAVACGNVGYPVLDAVLAGYDVLAVELSSFQLHWSHSLAPAASVVLNVAEDHLDWHGSMAEYAKAKGKIYQFADIVVTNVDDATSVRLADEFAGAQARRIGFTVQTPRPHELGVVEDLLVDRAFVDDPVHNADELATVKQIRPPGPHNVANALAAAALARAYGVSTEVVNKGLAEYQPQSHRAMVIAEANGVRYVNDSKATNPHAARGSLATYSSIVWIAGGQLKNASVDDLVRAVGNRLRGVVLLGVDAPILAEALARHAPDVPVHTLDPGDDKPMTTAVTIANTFASPGDVVLLAPAAASLDMFRNYGQRGDDFADAVRRAIGDQEAVHGES